MLGLTIKYIIFDGKIDLEVQQDLKQRVKDLVQSQKEDLDHTDRDAQKIGNSTSTQTISMPVSDYVAAPGKMLNFVLKYLTECSNAIANCIEKVKIFI